VYTGQIAFATLSSQDVTPSKEAPQVESNSPLYSEGLSSPPPGAAVVEPCSPKSAYCLANKVCLSPLLSDAVTDGSFTQVDLAGLCDIASKDIQSKLDESNILQELFSPFAAKSVIPQVSTAHWANITPTQPQAYQRNGARALPVQAEAFGR
jgi:hypothetical protein